MTFVFEVGASGGYAKKGIQVSVSKVRSNIITDTYICDSVESFQSTLNVGGIVGTLNLILGNTDGAIFDDVSSQPHAQDIIHIRARNRHGFWGPVWTGYINEVHRIDDPIQGRQCAIAAESPQKIFEIRTQLPGDVEALAISSLGGLSGSAILRYVCKLPIVNYPGALSDLAQALGYEPSQASKILVDANADSGIANWDGISAGIIIAPDLETWSAVLQSVIGDSGLEMFFDEMGSLYWRQPKYLTGLGGNPIILDEDDLMMRDLYETDNGVLTQVTVRYGAVELLDISVTRTTAQDNKGTSKGSDPIKEQLGQRATTVYANWITGPATATNLANLLLEIAASNVLCGTIVIPANPQVKVGSLVKIPTGRRINAAGDAEWGIYYVASVAAVLNWGESWTYVLGLQYGHGVNTGWGYPGAEPYPVISVPAGQLPTNKTIISVDSNNPAKILQKWTLQSDATLSANEAIVDPNLIPAGTQFLLTTTDGLSAVGPANQGVYTAVAGIPGSGYVITLQSQGPDKIGMVTLSQVTPAGPSFSGSSDGNQDQAGTPPTPYDPDSPANSVLNTFESLPYAGSFAGSQNYGATVYATTPNPSKGAGACNEPFYTDPPSPTSLPQVQYAGFHTGIDIYSTAGVNSQILSVSKGIVIGTDSQYDLGPVGYIGGYSCNSLQSPCVHGVDLEGFGNCVVVLFGKYLVHYGHMFQINVKIGDVVVPGTVLGLEGSTGNSSGSHCHLGVWDTSFRGLTGRWMDPKPFFTRGGLTLPDFPA